MTTGERLRLGDKDAFYAGALSRAEAANFSQALEVDGIDQEIAALRLRLRTLLAEQPEDLAKLFKGMEVLARLVTVKYRLPKDASDELTDHLKRALGQAVRDMLTSPEPSAVEAHE